MANHGNPQRTGEDTTAWRKIPQLSFDHSTRHGTEWLPAEICPSARHGQTNISLSMETEKANGNGNCKGEYHSAGFLDPKKHCRWCNKYLYRTYVSKKKMMRKEMLMLIDEGYCSAECKLFFEHPEEYEKVKRDAFLKELVVG